MIAMPLIPVVVRFFGREIFRSSRETQERLSQLSAYVLENFSGIRVVQAYAQEQNQIDGLAAISVEYRRKTMWLATLWGIRPAHEMRTDAPGALARRGQVEGHRLWVVVAIQRVLAM